MNQSTIYAFFLLSFGTAFAGDIQVSLERKKTGLRGEQAQTGLNSGTQKWVGEVKIESGAAQPTPELQARYVIYVRRQNIGQKVGEDQVQEVSGEAAVPSLKRRAPHVFDTSEIELRQQALAPNYYLKNGGMTKASDSITGVWVKVFKGGVEVGEYVNPTFIKEKYKWKQP
jgi:hypothetical protein